MSTLLEVVGLSGGYSRAPILHDVSLEVGENEIVGVLGANGAGKTSLLRALSGLLPVARGEIRLAGVSLSRKKPWARAGAGLAHVPEGRHVFGAMTVRENLDVATLLRRNRSIHIDDVFDLFPRLRERARQSAGSLSGGEQQMLAIGRALVTAPRLLAVDELSAGLAPLLVHQLVDALLRLRGRGIGILLIEQSPHFIAEAVDRVLLLEQGRVVGAGTLAELGGPAAIAELYLGLGR